MKIVKIETLSSKAQEIITATSIAVQKLKESQATLSELRKTYPRSGDIFLQSVLASLDELYKNNPENAIERQKLNPALAESRKNILDKKYSQATHAIREDTAALYQLFRGEAELTRGVPMASLLEFAYIAVGKPVTDDFIEPDYAQIAQPLNSLETAALFRQLSFNVDSLTNATADVTQSQELRKAKL